MRKKSIAIVATGPSATAVDLERLRDIPTLAVNDAWRLVPWAQWLYACDPQWWEVHFEEVREKFHGELWTQDEKAQQRYGLNRVIGNHSPGISTEPGVIHFNGNSGAQALNLAVLWGYKNIVLCGFDMRVVDGKRHWFGDHPDRLNKPSPYGGWITKYRQIAQDLKRLGVKVYNCSPHTALRSFPVMELDDAIGLLPDSDSAAVPA